MRPTIAAIVAGRLLVGFGLLAATAASADWPPGGLLVSTSFAPLIEDAHFLVLPGGDLSIVSVASCACNSNYFTLQRVSPSGVLAQGWPAAGVSFTGVLRGIRQFRQSFIVDDSARVWHSWDNGSSCLQSIAGDGTPSPAPATSLYTLSTPAPGPTHAAEAPGGDVFVTCGSSRIKRITPTGSTAAGWPAAGRGLPGLAYDDNAVLNDGSGGVVVFMRKDAGGGPPLVTRLTGTGAVHAGWDGFGLALSGEVASLDNSFDSQLLLSGPDHFLAVWSTAARPGLRRLIMQRFGSDGTIDPAWPGDGLEVVAADTLAACRAIPDGSDGAYVLRQAHGHPVGTHVTAAGTMLGGTDVSLTDAAAQYLPSQVIASAPDELIADHTPDGGLLVGWNDTRLAPAVSFRLRWLTSSLTAAAGKPDSGVVVYSTSPHPTAGSLVALHADGPDAAFIAWGDIHGTEHDIGYGDLWVNRVQAPVVVGVGQGASPATRLALSAPRPNPAQVAISFDVTLPDDSPARVELLDIAGRVQRTQLVQGAGAHAVTFGNAGSLAPGLYFARVSSRAGAHSVRVVLTR
jgi:hypothetical protein